MKRIMYLSILVVSSSVMSFTDKSFMAYRSQGFNLARNNSGWLNRCENNNFSVAIEYQRSFNPSAINNYYFGCNKLVFSGSRAEQRGARDILADNYGLPTDFKSSICFSPRIQNIITDFDMYWILGCDDDSRLSLRVNVPLVHTKWALNPCETVIDAGFFDYPAGYMSANIITHAQLRKGALEALSGEKRFGDLTFPLQYGRISRCAKSLTKFSDVSLSLGYNVICKEKGMLALGAHVVVPTGTRPDARCFFEPQIGNGHHWALGGNLLARYDVVKSEEIGDLGVSVYFDAYIQHLCKTTQKRSYDFIKNGPGSRYMLIMDMVRNVSLAQGFSATPGQDLINRQYITRLKYGVDASTLDSKIKVDVQADLTAKALVAYRNWTVQAGYGFWVRSHEKLASRESLTHQFYGIKGDVQLYGFLPKESTLLAFDIPIPLNATQSKASLHAPQGNGNTTDNFVNNNADNPALMYNVAQTVQQTTVESLSNTGATSQQQVNGSKHSIVLTDSDINECSGLSPRALTHKVFGSVSYQFESSYYAQPYILLGAEAEFAGESDHRKTAISQWGIWIKGGFSY